MSYRANVRVMMLTKDETTGKPIAVDRKDMGFTVNISNPSKGTPAAKEYFDKKYGPDLMVRCCNLQSRQQILLYCISKAEVPGTVAVQKMSAFARHQ